MKSSELQCYVPRSFPRAKLAQIHPLLPLRVDFIKLALLGSLLLGHLQPLRFGPPHMLLHAPARLANVGLLVGLVPPEESHVYYHCIYAVTT